MNQSDQYHPIAVTIDRSDRMHLVTYRGAASQIVRNFCEAEYRMRQTIGLEDGSKEWLETREMLTVQGAAGVFADLVDAELDSSPAEDR